MTAESEYELIYAVVNRGQGSKALRTARRCGINRGHVFLATGTASSRLLELFGLSDIKKEIVLFAAEKTRARKTLEVLNKEFGFEKPNNGIAFTIPVYGALKGDMGVKASAENERVGETMYHAITAIVEKGRAEDVIDAAVKAGSKGGTIINARGSGIEQTGKLFSMEIEPEKEIVLILSENHMTDAIVKSIREHLKIDEPGSGIIYIQDTSGTCGLYK